MGLQYAPVEMGEDAFKVIRLWANECLRVFYDRLINDQDRLWFCNLVGEMLEKHFKERFGKVYGGFTHSEVKKGDITPALLQYSMAGDFMVPGAEPTLVATSIHQHTLYTYTSSLSVLSQPPLSCGHWVVGITNGHSIHAGPLLRDHSFYLSIYPLSPLDTRK